jgi:hypothetical protein
VRQASGLLADPSTPSAWWTFNDGGLQDNPGPGEDTATAALYPIDGSTGRVLGRYVIADASGPIAVSDTEAITTTPSGQVLFGDTGTNRAPRSESLLLRFSLAKVTTTQPYTAGRLGGAQRIRIAYANGNGVVLAAAPNVEAMVDDSAGNLWLIARGSATVPPLMYEAVARDLDAAAASGGLAVAVSAGKLGMVGPVTDAAITADGQMVYVKTLTATFAYSLSGTTVGAALQASGCQVGATTSTRTQAGYGKNLGVAADGSFVTMTDGTKQAVTQSMGMWSFR